MGPEQVAIFGKSWTGINGNEDALNILKIFRTLKGKINRRERITDIH